MPTPTPTASATCEPGFEGDATGDGVIDAGDITKVERILAGDPATPCADANQDGTVNATDIAVIEYIILEIWPWNYVHIEAPDNMPFCTNFTADVFVTYMMDFKDMSLVITYNDSILDLNGVLNGSMAEIKPGVSLDFYTVNITAWSILAPGVVQINGSIFEGVGVDAAGFLARLQMHVGGSAGQTSPLNLSPPQSWLKDSVGGNLAATWGNDSVTVAGE